MNRTQALLFYSTAGIEAVLFVLVFARGLQKRLPFFAGYICLQCAGTIALRLVYNRYGFQSVPSYYGYWIVVGTTLFAQGFAIADLCRYELRAYRGVWELAWRILGTLALLTFLNALVDAGGRANWIPPFVTAISRDMAIASVTVLSALLLIRRYYGIQMESFERGLAGGMLFVCLVDAANHTFMQAVFLRNADHWIQVRSQVLPLYHMWDNIKSIGFIVALCIWCSSLLRPLPAPPQAPRLLSAEVYADLSPAINLRLRSYSNRLLEMLKI